MLAEAISDKPIGLRQYIALLNRLYNTFAKRPLKQAIYVFDDDLKFKFYSWNCEVKTYHTCYEIGFDREEDKISWLKESVKIIPYGCIRFECINRYISIFMTIRWHNASNMHFKNGIRLMRREHNFNNCTTLETSHITLDISEFSTTLLLRQAKYL
jgi:hypothetical protein